VKDHVPVSVVVLVPVRRPVGRPHVQFHVARPEGGSDADAGVEEVGAGIPVVLPAVDDFHRLAGRSQQRALDQARFPDIMEKILFHGPAHHEYK
jgi:hypothetical protein